MAMSTLQLLEKVPFFAGLGHSDRQKIADLPHAFIRFDKGEYILREGEMGNALYIMINGQADVFQGEKVISRIANGQLFGEMGYLNPVSRRLNNVVSSTDQVVVMKITDKSFHQLGIPVREKIRDELIRLLLFRVEWKNREARMYQKIIDLSLILHQEARGDDGSDPGGAFSGDNRRRKERYPFQVETSLFLSSQSVSGRLGNISTYGAFIVTPTPMGEALLNQSGKLSFQSEQMGDEKEFTLSCQVVRVDDDGFAVLWRD
ncbi:MAG: cyclic nucleotide-binding domain-containing protein [Magnetococcales bacterium]|nr:cyclic nucleotide-binding domain-containing protein [Magnetococcales bacterium]